MQDPNIVFVSYAQNNNHLRQFFTCTALYFNTFSAGTDMGIQMKRNELSKTFMMMSD